MGYALHACTIQVMRFVGTGLAGIISANQFCRAWFGLRALRFEAHIDTHIDFANPTFATIVVIVAFRGNFRINTSAT